MSKALTAAARVAMAALVLALAAPASAQQAVESRQRLGSVEESLRAGAALSGRAGPRSVNWIDDGARFSFTRMNAQTRRAEILRYDPVSGREQPLIDIPLLPEEPTDLASLESLGKIVQERLAGWARYVSRTS